MEAVKVLRRWLWRLGQGEANGEEMTPELIQIRNQADEIAKLRAELAAARRESENWKDSAAQFARGQEFYQGIVAKIGEMFGVAAKTSDDGSVQDSVLALRVPELVERQQTEFAKLRALLRQCAIVIRKVQEEDNFYLPDEICGNAWDDQLAFIARLEDAAGRGEGV